MAPTPTGAQVMGSEGYLINQFIAKHTNKRTDEWCVSPGADVSRGAAGEPSPRADVAGVSSVPVQVWAGASPVPVKLWVGVSPVPVRMWRG